MSRFSLERNSAMKNRLPPPPPQSQISDAEFAQFQKLIFKIAGISLSDRKKDLVTGRLTRRVDHFGFNSFAQYYRHVSKDEHAGERQIMVDLLTTNETYFFREPKHFDFLREVASRHRPGLPFRVWSAASSTGEEAYSIAMVLAESIGSANWEIVGTDISSRVLDKARSGHYSLDRIDGIPRPLLQKYCLKGMGEYDGSLLIVRELRQRVDFLYSNLMAPTAGLGTFDVIFLRNVMIYFDQETKRKVIGNLLPYLKADGHLLIGHSETLNGVTDDLVAVRPTIYRRAGPHRAPSHEKRYTERP